MSLLSFIQYSYFRRYQKLVNENRYHADKCQQHVFQQLINSAKNTLFGKEHQFEKIKTHDDFTKLVPVREYEEINPYIQKILLREESVLWPGLPLFLSKTSGTSGDPKYLPITNEFLRSTQFAAKYMLCNLSAIADYRKFLGKEFFYLTDQQNFEEVNGFRCGAISSIKSFYMPGWASRFSVPKKEINNIADPAKKIDAIIESIQHCDIRTAVALPVYLSHFLKQFEVRTGNKFKNIFPNFNVLFLSGMNYEPYESLMRQHLGKDTIIMENYSATEGNFAYQAVPGKKGMELICNQGVFYEFIPIGDADKGYPLRLPLHAVEKGMLYNIIISANSGLWAYRMNDIVEFISTEPYRLVVNGRLKDIFSPFGEHMLPLQAEQAIAETCRQTHQTLTDFIMISDFNFKSYRYKCYAEFESEMNDSFAFSTILHKQLCKNNSYYHDLVKTGAVTMPKLIPVKNNSFEILTGTSDYYAQQKMTHLISDKNIIAKLESILDQLIT
ncbi:MAG: GH3 auxin-responsive promoter family protein [Ginsengibacter sp.]